MSNVSRDFISHFPPQGLNFVSFMSNNRSIWRVIDVLNWTSDYFSRNGIENPRLEAEWLLGHFLNLKRLDIYLNFEKPLKREELKSLREAIKERISGKPLQLITGKVQFMGLDMLIEKGVLIPRPETETLVEYCIELLKPLSKPLILDVGCGSGNIALSLAHFKEDSRIVAIDKSLPAIEISRRNIDKYGYKSRVELQQIDWEDFDYSEKFDLIVCNPPYVREQEYQQLPPEIKDWEPREALIAGEDGLDFIRALVKRARRFLKQDGWLVFEIGIDMEKSCEKLLQEAGYKNVKIIQDLSSNPRVMVCQY